MKWETYLRAFEAAVVEMMNASRESTSATKRVSEHIYGKNAMDQALVDNWRWWMRRYLRRMRQARRFRKKLLELLGERS